MNVPSCPLAQSHPHKTLKASPKDDHVATRQDSDFRRSTGTVHGTFERSRWTREPAQPVKNLQTAPRTDSPVKFFPSIGQNPSTLYHYQPSRHGKHRPATSPRLASSSQHPMGKDAARPSSCQLNPTSQDQAIPLRTIPRPLPEPIDDEDLEQLDSIDDLGLPRPASGSSSSAMTYEHVRCFKRKRAANAYPKTLPYAKVTRGDALSASVPKRSATADLGLKQDLFTTTPADALDRPPARVHRDLPTLFSSLPLDRSLSATTPSPPPPPPSTMLGSTCPETLSGIDRERGSLNDYNYLSPRPQGNHHLSRPPSQNSDEIVSNRQSGEPPRSSLVSGHSPTPFHDRDPLSRLLLPRPSRSWPVSLDHPQVSYERRGLSPSPRSQRSQLSLPPLKTIVERRAHSRSPPAQGWPGWAPPMTATAATTSRLPPPPPRSPWDENRPDYPLTLRSKPPPLDMDAVAQRQEHYHYDKGTTMVEDDASEASRDARTRHVSPPLKTPQPATSPLVKVKRCSIAALLDDGIK